MASSITDVARAAGVSVATVSRAIRGLPNVAPATRDRVLAAAASLSYVADPNASRLAAGRTLSVGIVASDLTGWWTSRVVAGAADVVAAAGYEFVLYPLDGAPCGRYQRVSAYAKRVDGLMLTGPPPETDLPAELVDSGLPLVSAGLRWPGSDWVGIDDRCSAAVAVRHLLNLGHQQIAVIGDNPQAEHRQTADRRQGYRDALSAAGLPVDPDLDVDGSFTAAGGAEAMARLLAAESLPTAVFSMSDDMAIGAIHTVRSAGLPVPTRVSVIGFDDHELASFTGLTTIHQPVREIGETAAEMLIEAITSAQAQEGSGSVGTGPRLVTLATRLCVRATTGPRRAAAATPAVP